MSVGVAKVCFYDNFLAKEGGRVPTLPSFLAVTSFRSGSMHLTCLSINPVPRITFIPSVGVTTNWTEALPSSKSAQSRVKPSKLNVEPPVDYSDTLNVRVARVEAVGNSSSLITIEPSFMLKLAIEKWELHFLSHR